MRWLYLLKLFRAYLRLRQITPSPARLLWQAVRGQDRQLIRLPQGQTLLRRITPPNLYGYLLLREAGLQLASEQPEAEDTLLWELRPGHSFHTRLTVGMDLMTLYEVFGRKDYGEDFAGQTVIDVGAYNGDSAVFFALHGAKRVIALEPYPPNFALAQANIQRMGLEERVTLLPLALGVQDGKAIFQVAPTEPDANALEPPKSPLQKLVRYESQVEVEVCSLPTLRVREGLEEIDFLKLDCEGCEFALLSSLSIEEMRRVRVWHIEYHARPQPLIEKLTAAGYKVEKQRDRGVLGYLVARRGKVQ